MADDDRRWHDSNSGADSGPVVWLLEGNQVLWCSAGAGVGILLFRLLHGTFNHSLLVAGGLALIPFVATTTFILTLRTGKPPSYAAEFLALLSQKLARCLEIHLGIGRTRSVIDSPLTSAPHPLIDDE